MPDPTDPGLPPDLPPEYAEAYRRGYERAYRQAAGERTAEPEPMVPETPAQDAEAVDEPPTPEPEPTEPADVAPDPGPARVSGPLFADEHDDATATLAVPVSALFEPEPEGPDPTIHRPTHRADEADPDAAPFQGTYDEPATVSEERPPGERPPWLVPALLGGAVLVLLLSAYGIGRLVSSSMNDASGAAKAPATVVMGGDSNDPSATPSKTHKPSGKPYGGQTDAAPVASASASCESAPGVDAAGNKVKYSPSNVYDGDLATAWRCDGSGQGDKLTIELGDPVKVGQVGLVPGYAKLDPRTGENRYKENNRITKVRWTFSDGTVVEQRFDPSPSNRTMQNKRIPVVKADRVVVEVLSSQPGPRNTIAVSEVRIGQVTG